MPLVDEHPFGTMMTNSAVMPFFERLSQGASKLTPSERKLVEYLLLTHPNGILDSANAIARHLAISPSTVVRFFSKIGYKSFAAAQREVRLEISTKFASPSQRASVTLPFEKAPSRQLINDVLEADIGNLRTTKNNLDLRTLEQIVSLLVSRNKPQRRIYLVGEKNSFAAAQFLRTQLNLCLPNVQILESRHSTVADNLLWIGAQDVLLVISMRRYSTTSIKVAEYFKSIGALVIGIVDSPASPIAEIAHHKLYASTTSPSAFDSYTAVFYLCNLLLAMVSIVTKAQLQQTLDRGEDLWRHFSIFQQALED